MTARRVASRAPVAWAALSIGLVALALLPPLQRAGAGRGAALSTLSAQAPVLGNTVLLGLGQAAAVAVLAGVLALAQSHDFRGRRLQHLLLVAPLLLPPWAMALALVVLFGRAGLLPDPAGRSIYGADGLLLAGSLQMLPLGYLGMLVGRRGVDQRAIDQARVLGVPGPVARRRFAWPRLAEATVAVGVMVFVEAITDLANPLVLGGGFEVLASRVHLAVATEYDLAGAAALAVGLALPTLLLSVPALRSVVRASHLHVLRSPAPAQRTRPEGTVWLAVAVAWVVAGVNTALLATVVLGSLGLGSGDSPGIQYLGAAVQGRGREALGHSLALPLLVLPPLAVTAVGLALVARRSGACGQVVRASLWLLGALPGVLVGVSLLLVVNQVGSGRAASQAFGWMTAVAIGLVHLLRTLPSAVEQLLAVLDQQPRGVEETARLLEPRRGRRFVAHRWPLLAPVMGQVLVTSFLRTLTAVSSVVFLTNSHVALSSVRALSQIDVGHVAGSCATAVWLSALGLLVVAACRPVRPTGE